MNGITLRWNRLVRQRFGILCFAICLFVPGSVRAEARKPLPDHIPPKRSSQIQDGFGINSDLPREPYLPWNRWWWTRMFDAGFKWIRIGQYENSSEPTRSEERRVGKECRSR